MVKWWEMRKQFTDEIECKKCTGEPEMIFTQTSIFSDPPPPKKKQKTNPQTEVKAALLKN